VDIWLVFRVVQKNKSFQNFPSTTLFLFYAYLLLFLPNLVAVDEYLQVAHDECFFCHFTHCDAYVSFSVTVWLHAQANQNSKNILEFKWTTCKRLFKDVPVMFSHLRILHSVHRLHLCGQFSNRTDSLLFLPSFCTRHKMQFYWFWCLRLHCIVH